MLEQLQALVGNDWSTEHLRSILPQINALGIFVQNQARGDLRPRFLLPDGNTWDYGPGGWVGRGNIGDWHSGQQGGTPPGGDGGPIGTPGGGGDVSGPGGGGSIGGVTPGQISTSSWFGGLPAQQSPTDYLRATPGYQFAFDEGQRAVQTSAASRGTLLTGGTLKQLARYGTGIADQTYDAATKRFLSLAALGAQVGTSPL